jgi:hypothetical protein
MTIYFSSLEEKDKFLENYNNKTNIKVDKVEKYE